MTRGTTPTVTIIIEGVEVGGFKDIEVSFKQSTVLINKKLSKGDVTVNEERNTVNVKLKQEETLLFKPQPVGVQVKFLSEDNVVFASNIVYQSMLDILDESVME